MKNLLSISLLVLVLALASGCANIQISVDTGSAELSADARDCRVVMHRYFNAFNVDDFETMGDSWHVPGWASMGSRSLSFATQKEVEQLYRNLLGPLREQGYDHSELLDEDIEILNESAALYRITFTRWLKNGQFMAPRVRSGVYTLLKLDGQWGINGLFVDADPEKRN